MDREMCRWTTDTYTLCAGPARGFPVTALLPLPLRWQFPVCQGEEGCINWALTVWGNCLFHLCQTLLILLLNFYFCYNSFNLQEHFLVISKVLFLSLPILIHECNIFSFVSVHFNDLKHFFSFLHCLSSSVFFLFAWFVPFRSILDIFLTYLVTLTCSFIISKALRGGLETVWWEGLFNLQLIFFNPTNDRLLVYLFGHLSYW